MKCRSEGDFREARFGERMAQAASAAQTGDTVKVHYKGTLDDGTVFDSSEGREPLEFTLGEGHVIPGFEALVDGLKVGETRSGRIPAEEAYGPHQDRLVMTVPRANLPTDFPLEVGLGLTVQVPSGGQLDVVVTEVDRDNVTLDANHPLAGQALTFEVTLVGVA